MSFIVIYDDGYGICLPFGWNSECKGALEAFTEKAALFPDRRSARRAISISTKWALLRKAQGCEENEDFTTGRKHLRVIPLEPERSAK